MKDPIFQRLLNLHPKFSDLSLGRIKKLLKKIDFDENLLPKVIHIAGTNGKGSTAAILKSILNHHGYSTHIYSTPHLVKFNERIQLRSKDISNQKLLKYLKLCENKNQGNLITFFEITTAAAFKAFQDHKADYLILEVGLGGRFDATNILKSNMASIITSIGLDHLDWLPENEQNVEKIIYEKTSKLLNSKIIVAKQSNKEITDCIKKTISNNNSNKFFYNENYSFILKENNFFYYEDQFGGIKLPMPNIKGQFQLENISTAIATLRTFKDFDIKDNFNIYNLCTTTGDYILLKEGHEDQPDLAYKYPNEEIKTLFKDG